MSLLNASKQGIPMQSPLYGTDARFDDAGIWNRVAELASDLQIKTEFQCASFRRRDFL